MFGSHITTVAPAARAAATLHAGAVFGMMMVAVVATLRAACASAAPWFPELHNSSCNGKTPVGVYLEALQTSLYLHIPRTAVMGRCCSIYTIRGTMNS